MLIMVILVALTLLGAILITMDNWLSGWMFAIGIITLVFSGTTLFIYMVHWIPSAKNSEIEYSQLISARATIQSIYESEEKYDKIALNSLVVDYNNKVIHAKTNASRPIFKEFYNQDLDWDGLEIIEWKRQPRLTSTGW